MTKGYTKNGEWAKVQGSVATIGLSEQAIDALGEVTFVELPQIGTLVTKGKTCFTIEAVKAATDFDSPLSGIVKSVNLSLQENPGLLNEDPENKAWIFTLEKFTVLELEDLLSQEAYSLWVSES